MYSNMLLLFINSPNTFVSPPRGKTSSDVNPMSFDFKLKRSVMDTTNKHEMQVVECDGQFKDAKKSAGEIT